MEFDQLIAYAKLRESNTDKQTEHKSRSLKELAITSEKQKEEKKPEIRKGGIQMKPTTKYIDYSDVNAPKPKVIKIPTNTQIEEIRNNAKLSEFMKEDLIGLHKYDEVLKDRILHDVEVCDRTMKQLELNGFNMEFRWSSFKLEDVAVFQREDPTDFIEDVRTHGYEPKYYIDINCNNLVLIMLCFSVSAITNKQNTLSDLTFYDVIRETNGIIEQDMLIRYEK